MDWRAYRDGEEHARRGFGDSRLYSHNCADRDYQDAYRAGETRKKDADRVEKTRKREREEAEAAERAAALQRAVRCGLDARIDPPPAPCDWRNRPPTAEEVATHAAAHPGGGWLVRFGAEVCDWWTHKQIVLLAEEIEGTYDEWRPYDRDGSPAAWPTEEVTDRG